MIFHIHFFIYGVSLSTIFTYTCVYAKYYAGVDNLEFGNLAMVLPFLALVAKPMICSLADSFRGHKMFLVGTMGTYLLGFGGLAILPYFIDRTVPSDQTIAWYFICFLIPLGYVSAGVLFSITDALASNYARKNNTSYSLLRIWSSIGWGVGALLMLVIKNPPWLPFRVPGLLIFIAVCIIDILIILLWRNKDDFVMSTGDPSEEKLKEQQKVGTTGGVGQSDKLELGIRITDSDKNNNNNSPANSPKKIPEYTVAINDEKSKSDAGSFKMQIKLFKLIAGKHKSLIRFLVLFTIYGLVQSCVWNFENDYIKETLTKTEAEFESISALCMLAQCVCGEAIIYILAPKMMEIFGLNANMTLCLLSIGMRCFAYANFLPYVSIYFVILTESLQGPSFGLFYCVMNEAGMKYSLMVGEFIPALRKAGIVNDSNEIQVRGCIRATMIGVMGACMEGLGIGVGASLAGFISTKFGYYALWNTAAAVGFTAGLVNISIDLIPKMLGQSSDSTDITKYDVEENNNNNNSLEGEANMQTSPTIRNSFPKKMPSDMKSFNTTTNNNNNIQ